MGGTTTTSAQRAQLGEFLRIRRAAVQPEDVGIPRRGRRLVSGLRRHEVADLAAVSLTWYTWIEQGRDINCTPDVLDAVARALQMDEVSRRYLRRLGGVPVVDHGDEGELDPSLVELLEDQLPSPACLLRPTNDLVAWNDAYARLFDDPARFPEERRNALILMLTSERIRERLVDWEGFCRAAIGAFRAEAANYPGDPRFAEIVELLSAESELFQENWPRHELHRLVGQTQRLHDPVSGDVDMHWLLLRPLGHSSLLLMINRLVDPARATRVA